MSQALLRVTKLFFLVVIIYFPLGLFSQDCRFTITGTVQDDRTQTPIEGASVFMPYQNTGAITDEHGHFKISGVCKDTTTIICSHIGCEHVVRKIKVEKDLIMTFTVHSKDQNLKEVVISEKKAPTRISQSSENIAGIELNNTRSVNLAETVKNLPGVTILQTGSTIAKPIIHGMHSDRLTILNNGIPQEGNQWGSEHAPEIDPFIAGKITVLKGAEGVRYGSNSLGGVILVEPEPVFSDAGLKAELFTGYSSNGRRAYASGSIANRLIPKIGLSGRLQGTIKRSGNLNTPDYYLANTGTKEYDFSTTLQLDREHLKSEIFYSQFNSWIGIFRGAHIGNVTDLLKAINSEQPLIKADFTYDLERPAQHIEHELLKWKSEYKLAPGSKFNMLLSRQFNRRGEYDAHKPFNPDLNISGFPEIMLELTTWQADVNYEHKIGKYIKGQIGTQANTQKNTTDGTLVPNYQSNLLAVYLIEHWKKFPNFFEFEVGLRFDKRRLDADLKTGAQRRTFDNMSGTAGIIYLPGPHWEYRLNYSRVWRAPNVSELFSYGLHHGTATFEIGNPALKPEIANSLTFSGVGNYDEDFDINFTAYFNKIKDFIYQQPDSMPTLTIRGAFPTFEHTQTDALIYGFDLGFKKKLVSNLSLSLKTSVLRGYDQSRQEYLIYMPSDRISSSLQYNFEWPGVLQSSTISLNATHVFKQSRVGHLFDYLQAPAAYQVFGLEFNTKFKIGNQPIESGIVVSNLFNNAYREYLNRFRYFADETGRNVLIHFNLKF